MQVPGRVLERAEDKNLLALQIPRQQFLEPFQLPVFCRQPLRPIIEPLEEFHVGFHVMGQLPQFVLVEIDGRQALDVLLRLGHGIQFVRHASGSDVVLFVPGQEANRLLKILRRDDLAVQQVVLVRFLEGQGPAQAQAKRLDAGFQPFEEAGLEDADQTFLPAFLELVLFLVPDGRLFLVRFQLVRCQGQRVDGGNDLVVQPAVCRSQVVLDGVQSPIRECDWLALDRGVRIGRTDVGPGVADHDLFEQVEQDHARRSILLFAPCAWPVENRR